MAGTWIERQRTTLMGGFLLGAMALAAAAWLAGLVGCTANPPQWSHNLARESLRTLAAARVLPGHDPVVIDGGDTSPHEWDAAARVPFATYGQGAFLWDEKGLYGRVSYSGGRGRQPWAPGINDVDSTCVLLSSWAKSQRPSSATSPAGGGAGGGNARHFRRLELHIVETHGAAGYTVALKAVNASSNFQLTSVDAGAVVFKSRDPRFNIAANAAMTPWSCEFFVPWELLDSREAPAPNLGIQVFRVRQEDPEFSLYMPEP